jgi:erythrin-vacuolar iron transport family protein
MTTLRPEPPLALALGSLARKRMQQKVRKNFVLQKVQPALLGLMDGAVSTLALIFAAAGLTGKPSNAFFVGLAASLGAGVSRGIRRSTTAASPAGDGRLYAAASPV